MAQCFSARSFRRVWPLKAGFGAAMVCSAAAGEVSKPPVTIGSRDIESVVAAATGARGSEGQREAHMLCGAYCLTYLAMLLHRDVSLEKIKELVSAGECGSSLFDLKRASRAINIPLEAVRCAPRSFDRLPLPAIAHLQPTDLWPVAHYVVLLRVDADKVVTFDPNTRTIDTGDRRRFLRASSGCYLIRATRGRWDSNPGMLVVLVPAVVTAGWLLVPRKSKLKGAK